MMKRPSCSNFRISSVFNGLGVTVVLTEATGLVDNPRRPSRRGIAQENLTAVILTLVEGSWLVFRGRRKLTC